MHQELSVLPNLDISENIFAGREPVKAAVLLDRRTEDARSARALASLRKPMQVRTKTAQLSLGCRQIVEIARTLDQGARVLILDEPTSALSSTETDSLFQVIHDLKRSGVTIIYISHRLHELLHLGDWFTVLRSGRIVGHAPRTEVSRNWIVERMSGRDVSETSRSVPHGVRRSDCSTSKELTLARQVRMKLRRLLLHAVSFTLRRGEILGIYGLLGAGRTELLESLAVGWIAGEVVAEWHPGSFPMSRMRLNMASCLCLKTASAMALFQTCRYARTLPLGPCGGFGFPARQRSLTCGTGEGTQHRCQRSRIASDIAFRR